MTRINYGIKPEQLTDQHLIAELAKELPRIPRKVRKTIIEGKEVNTYDGEFKLGSGHVRYFYDKLGYLKERYNSLYQESLKRGFKVNYDERLFLDGSHIHQYFKTISEDEIKPYTSIVKDRITTRIKESTQVPRYYGKVIDKDYYIKNILRYS